ncbi:MAG: hypothetical protein ACC645_11605 [Pirellulales bacterium]
MTEPEHSNHWKSLAEDLGADPSDTEPQPPVDSDPETPPQPKPQKRRAAATVPSPTSDWDGLAKRLRVEGEEQADPHVDTASADEVAPPSDSQAVPDDVLDEDTVAAAVTRVVEEVAEENIDFGDTDTEGDGNLAPNATDASTEATDEADRPTRRRRRRRPRRRSGRNKASANDTARNGAETSGAEDDSEAMSDEAVVAESAPDATDGPDDSQEANEDSDDSGKSPRPSHRNIPTWDEAIGVIVDANIEARSSRPKSARAGGSRGRSRSRPRGRNH